uniref:UBC core domain-containing protein n=1 Tax=Plectus sambesii TaxID=2011161 RepID=A0A914VVG4_9BILA
MGTAVSSMSSPEPDDSSNHAERAMQILNQKPLRMAQMLRLSRIINDSSPDEKLQLHRGGMVAKLCELIADCGSMLPKHEAAGHASDSADKRRRNNRRHSSVVNGRGVGYGHGSTRSRWDIERTVEERLAREEHLIWLLNAMTAYLYCASPDFGDTETALDKFAQRQPAHLTPNIVEQISESAVVPLLEYHLKNDSVFDVSEHMELYQALLEVACSMALIPGFVPYLVKPYAEHAKSIVKDLIPKFREIMSAYPNALRGQMGSPDFRLIDFINKINRFSELLYAAAHRYEKTLPPEQRVKTARPRTTHSEASLSRKTAPEVVDDRPRTAKMLADISAYRPSNDPHEMSMLYSKSLKHLQIQTYKFIGDYGKLAVPYTFKKESRNLNPFSPTLKERTKRIAKELASMPNTLPLNASNSIFVCVDEGRCDIMKVLISGPDDTPYQNGLFEFDVFFPTSYPFSPPKCSFLTTGAGNVRFNPNLYNDGKICLSILGTWEGRPEEKWNPYCSLLQVLISIQGLIFVKEPYFNEPSALTVAYFPIDDPLNFVKCTFCRPKISL